MRPKQTRICMKKYHSKYDIIKGKCSSLRDILKEVDVKTVKIHLKIPAG
jgi:hypothetical protein